MQRSESVDICIIGAGLAGLTAALLAARRGLDVRVLTGRCPGGRAISDRVDGFALDRGAHALYLRGDAARTWEALGVHVPGAAPRFPLYAEADGRRDRLPSDAPSLLASALLSWPSKLRLGTIFGRLGTLARAAGPGPFGAWLDARTDDADVRRVLLGAARLSTFTADPRPLRAAAVLRQLQLVGSGVRYVDGGWQTAVDLLAGAAREAGAALVPARATAVRPGPAGYVVRADDDIHCSSVIVATGPAAFSRLTGLALPDLTPVRAAALDLGLRRLPDPELPFVLDLDRPRYGSAQSLAADLAPPGAAVLHLVAYLGPDEVADRSDLEAWLDGWQPGWRDEVQVARWWPALVVQHRAALAEAPVLPVEAAPGLLRAGDWVGEGFLTDAAVSSALEAVDRAALHLARRRAG